MLDEDREGGELKIADLRVTTFAVPQMCTGVSIWYRTDGPLLVDQLCDVYEELVLTMLKARPPHRQTSAL